MSYPTDYKEIDGGYVAFGGNPNGGKITRYAKKRVIYVIKSIINAMIIVKIAMVYVFLFWSTAMAKTINGEVHLHVKVDGKKIIVTESSVRRGLRLAYEEDEVVQKELGDRLMRATTAASSLEAEQDTKMFDVNDLGGKEMFDRAFKRVNTFEDYKTKLVEKKEKKAGEELIQESTKKQNMEHDNEIAELKQLMEIILDKKEVAIDAIRLAVKWCIWSTIVEEGEPVDAVGSRATTLVIGVMTLEADKSTLGCDPLALVDGFTPVEDNIEVLMMDWLSIDETDKMINIVENDIVKLVVEIESFGMISDKFDEQTGSFDGL
nr:hypothetical protein [Tanacetum cinerariifolium]